MSQSLGNRVQGLSVLQEEFENKGKKIAAAFGQILVESQHFVNEQVSEKEKQLGKKDRSVWERLFGGKKEQSQDQVAQHASGFSLPTANLETQAQKHLRSVTGLMKDAKIRSDDSNEPSHVDTKQNAR